MGCWMARRPYELAIKSAQSASPAMYRMNGVPLQRAPNRLSGFPFLFMQTLWLGSVVNPCYRFIDVMMAYQSDLKNSLSEGLEIPKIALSPLLTTEGTGST